MIGLDRMSRAKRMRTIAPWLLGAWLCGSAVGAFPAAAGEPEGETSSGLGAWSFELTPYLWLPEQQGRVQVRDLSASIDVDFGDVFDLLGNGELFAGMLHLEAKNGPLSLFVDGVGGTMQPTQKTERATTDTTLNYAFIEFGPAYRIFEYPSAKPEGRPIQIDALAGGRFMYFYQEIDVKGSGGLLDREADASFDWVDPFVGGRFLVPLVGGLDLFFRADIGGFDAGSELAWNVVGGFKVELPWQPGSARTALIAGYKALDFDYEGGNDGRVSLNIRGPALGLMFTF